MKLTFIYKGGKGSGNFGHSGRKGKIGGSGSGSGGLSGGMATAPRKLPRKITISQASKILDDEGYKLGRGRTDLKAGKTFYQVTNPSGKTSEMSVDDIKLLLETL